MRRTHGFTLIELAVTVAIVGVLATIAVMYGRSAKQAGDLASLSWELTLRASALKARAMANNKEFVLLVVDGKDNAACQFDATNCGKAVVFANPTADFKIAAFDPDPPYTTVEYQEEVAFPRNARLDVTDVWTAPAPFSSVTAMDSALLGTCKDGRRCAAIRYKLDGTVEPFTTTGASPGTLSPRRQGFALILQPVVAPSGAAQRRAILVGFPSGIVKTSVF